MSRPLSKEEYQKRFFNRFMSWINGKKDPFSDYMPSDHQKEAITEEEMKHLYDEEKLEVIEHVQDIDHNKIYKGSVASRSSHCFCLRFPIFLRLVRLPILPIMKW